MSRRILFGAGALQEVPAVAAELGARTPMVVTTSRGAAAASRLAVAAVYAGVRPHVPVETVQEAAAAARAAGADALVALGGGSSVDTAKAAAVELLADGPMPVIAVPTTYAGAEWTPNFGVLLAPGRKGGGRDERARPAAAVYDPELTLGLPRAATVGTALNALAHCAEAFYHPSRSDEAIERAAAGAAAIATALPLVVGDPSSLEQRTQLLRGAMDAALALDSSGLCLGHAMAQGLGGRYGLPQGTMNALCLPAALRFNAVSVPDEVAAFGAAVGGDGAATAERLASLGEFGRLRDHGVPERELEEVASEIAARPGARANPRPATPADVASLLRSIW